MAKGGRPSLSVSKGDEHFYQQPVHGQQQHGSHHGHHHGWEDDEEPQPGSSSEGEDEEMDCPLCLEVMDESDVHFFPCPCSYQVCRACGGPILTAV